MHRENRPDFELAIEQWHNLVSNIRRAGAKVEMIEPVTELPDMVYVANAGLVDGQRLILSRFRHAERQPESIYTSQWFQARGCEVAELFFFSSRRRHTRSLCDWSSDVCSSD